MAVAAARILIVDGEEIFLNATADLLRREGYDCACAMDAAAAVRMLRVSRYDLLICDLSAPGNARLKLVRGLPPEGKGMAVIVMTAYPSMQTAMESVQLPVVAYLPKPVAFSELLAHVQTAVRRAREGRRLLDLARQAELDFHQALDASLDALCLIDEEFNLLHVNDAFLALTDTSREEAARRKCYELMPCGLCHGPDCPMVRIKSGEERVQYEFSNRTQKGDVVSLLVTAVPNRDADTGFNGIIKSLRDVSNQKHAVQAFVQNEARFHCLFRGIADGILVYSSEGQILDANEVIQARLGKGLGELQHLDIRQVMTQECAAEATSGIETTLSHGTSTHEVSLVSASGETLVCEALNHVTDYSGDLAILSVLRDVSERRQLEHQLRQAQRMEAVGRLAGGVAHDFNNLVAVIAMYADLLMDGLEGNEDLRGYVGEINKAVEGASSVTRQLLAFGRKQVLRPEVLSLNATVRNLHEMFDRLIGEDIDLHLQLASDLWPIEADRGQVEQIIMNLALNARDAMPKGGELSIETTNVDVGDRPGNDASGPDPGPYVLLTIADTGCGMDQETQSQVFDPFFTTKETGRGTGLGLSTVYGIVKQSGGHVSLQSEPGNGSTFGIYLPRSLASPPAQPEASGHDRGMRRSRREIILLVEDEQIVRKATSVILRNHHYVVLEAGSPSEAIEISQRHSGSIHLLLTDVIMPQMNGLELAEHLCRERPDMLVLFMSGYPQNVLGAQGVLDPGFPFIDKPFRGDALAGRVREVLDGPSEPSRATPDLPPRLVERSKGLAPPR